jgi:phage I-like protein
MLYAAHQKINPLDDNFKQESLRNLLMGLESDRVKEVEGFLAEYDPSRVNDLEGLFGDAVETEMKFYRKYVN